MYNFGISNARVIIAYMSAGNRGADLSESEQLFRSLAEQLKLPLMHISQAAELARSGGEVNLGHIESIADMALRLVDSYVLSTQLSANQQQMALEPVSISSVLHDAAEKLNTFARQYSCDIELNLAGKYGPIMANRQSLESAITALGYSFIEAQEQQGVGKSRLVLAAHRNEHGIVAGAYGDYGALTTDMFKRAKQLHGKARQPMPGFGHAPSAGIFIADSLCNAMSSKLRVAKHSNLTGLAATFVQTPQMQLVIV